MRRYNLKREKKNHAKFMSRTLASYRHQTERAIESAPLLVKGLPFTLQEFRLKVFIAIGKPCEWCGVKITEKNFAADHIVPTSRGGGWDLCNISVICKRSNEHKGNLTASEFNQLHVAIYNWPKEAKADIWRRLRSVPVWRGKRSNS